MGGQGSGLKPRVEMRDLSHGEIKNVAKLLESLVPPRSSPPIWSIARSAALVGIHNTLFTKFRRRPAKLDVNPAHLTALALYFDCTVPDLLAGRGKPKQAPWLTATP